MRRSESPDEHAVISNTRMIAFLASRGRLIDMGKDLLCGEETIQRRREAGVDGHLHEDFGDLVARQSDIQCRLDMHLELRRRRAHGCKRCDRGNLAVAQRQAGT